MPLNSFNLVTDEPLFKPQPFWQSMDTAPRNRPILVMCSSECNDVHCGYSKVFVEPLGRKTLCMYHAHAEGLSAYGSGPAIVVWGGGWEDGYEDGGGSMPDWWFIYGSECEVAANPIAWYDIQLGTGEHE